MNAPFAIRNTRERHEHFASELLAGLFDCPKRIAPKFFYDAQGSALFERICDLPEYYLTRTEMALLRAHAAEIANYMGRDVELVEFGAGALQKVRILLDALHCPRAYVPVDISGDYLSAVVRQLSQRYPDLGIYPVIADFTKDFALPAIAAKRRIGFFPGSTIGNLDRGEALAFLRQAAKLLRGGGLLVGVDLVKDPAILHAAYNDAAGVTAAFNKNMLARANRELDADFDLGTFAHYAFYNPLEQRIEMHLVSLADQHRIVAGEQISFTQGETIHTENSCKYTPAGFRALAAEAGFKPRAAWYDAEHLFSLHWLEAPGTNPFFPR
jgi:L-histidine Nalpha-methyltransferase